MAGARVAGTFVVPNKLVNIGTGRLVGRDRSGDVGERGRFRGDVGIERRAAREAFYVAQGSNSTSLSPSLSPTIL